MKSLHAYLFGFICGCLVIAYVVVHELIGKITPKKIKKLWRIFSP
jgi:hypothetical protein